MFGYITINKPELKIKDYNKYQAYYCGLCKALKKRHGVFGQMTLTYDMTFLVVLLSGLYEPQEQLKNNRCIAHPIKHHQIISNSIMEYAADMNIILAYHNLLDDWVDDKNIAKFGLAKILEKEYLSLKGKYTRQIEAVEAYVLNLHQCEKDNIEDLDYAAGLTGKMLGEILRYKEDEWSNILQQVGYFLGKYIYLLDAYEDLEKDKKTNSYNPFCITKEKEVDYEKILVLMMADCSREFEKLPILMNAEILRNILYAGVWLKFDSVKALKNKAGEIK